MEFLRHMWEKYVAPKQEDPLTREHYRASELAYGEELIRHIYITGQVNLSSLPGNLKELGEPSSSQAKETIRRIKFGATTIHSRFSDQVAELGVDKILKIVGATPEEGKRIRSQALQEARDYWVDRLTQPDLTPNEVLLGRRRVTQLTEKLDKLNKPPSTQQP